MRSGVRPVPLPRGPGASRRRFLTGAAGLAGWSLVPHQAWAGWLAHQTMLINEHRLNPLEKKTRDFLAGEMEKHFFGSGAEMPAGYVPPDA